MSFPAEEPPLSLGKWLLRVSTQWTDVGASTQPGRGEVTVAQTLSPYFLGQYQLCHQLCDLGQVS
jgi:hypothetical protein